MLGQRVANIVNGVDQRVGELLVAEMVAHFVDEALPQLLAALLVDRFVADDRKFVGARRDPDQNVVVVSVFMQSQSLKSFLGGDERIVFYLAALNEDADLAGSFQFRLADRVRDLIVFKIAEKLLCSHRSPASA